MLRERLAARGVRCWLVNTGWSGGPYGVGKRMSIAFTRRLLQAALDGELDAVDYAPHPVFKVLVPQSCPGIPAAVAGPTQHVAGPGGLRRRGRQTRRAVHRELPAVRGPGAGRRRRRRPGSRRGAGMSPTPSSVVTALPASGIRRMMAKASAMENVARLDVGEPQFATPPHIVEAACLAARQGATKYAPSGGLRSTREAIAAAIAADSGTPVTWENVVVTLGAVGALISAVRTAVEPGDEVLVPDPGWPNYLSLTRVSGGVPVSYALDAEHGFMPAREHLEAACTPRTRAVIINTPGNPTGAVFSRATMEEVLGFARAHDLYVISDEVYSKIVYEGPFTSAWGLGENDRVIVANSVSKTYSMTGWRLGWALAEPSVAALIAKLQEAYISCSPTLSQKAADAALSRRPVVHRHVPQGVQRQPRHRRRGAPAGRHRL